MQIEKLNQVKGWMDANGKQNFYFIQSLKKESFTDSNNRLYHNLEIILSKNIGDEDTVHVKFFNVNSLKIDMSLTQLSSIDIVDNSEYNWESCNYKLFCYEGDEFEFFFEDFEIE